MSTLLDVDLDRQRLQGLYDSVRRQTIRLAQPLSEADATVQSMPDASPTKWHLAHTTWFFEAMVLEPYSAGYRSPQPDYHRLFNSYYESLGERHPRPRRGLLTRPSLDEVLAYRAHVDRAIAALFDDDPGPGALSLIELGCHHEQQHQELILTDILHLFAQNPLRPAYRFADGSADRSTDGPAARLDDGPADRVGDAEVKRPSSLQAMLPSRASMPLRFIAFEGGIVDIGHDGAGFAFDCEGPRHRVVIEPFELANRPVTNAEWYDFIEDGGYQQALLWLSEGWARVCAEGWRAPLYWERVGDDRGGAAHVGLDGYRQMTLAGLSRLDPAAPVCHLSYFEADAFAQWAGARLPTEFEWELAARAAASSARWPSRSGQHAHFADSGGFSPLPARGDASMADDGALHQLFGDVWEWTRSPFAPYPRFRPMLGAAGEYNGKFMCGQYVLRGGSCVTPAGHLRPTYRNFFPPDARWQFSGMRLAKEADA